LSWLDKALEKRDALYADYIALDLLDLLGQCKEDSTHVKKVLEMLTFIVTQSFTMHNAEVRISSALTRTTTVHNGRLPYFIYPSVSCSLYASISDFCLVVPP
jgi:hypothetical protein